MKRQIIALVGSLLLIFMMTSCSASGSRSAITAEKFSEAAEKCGYNHEEYTDTDKAYAKYSGLDEMLKYTTDTGRIGYYLYSTEELAQQNYFESVNGFKTYEGKIKQVDSATYNRAEITATGTDSVERYDKEIKRVSIRVDNMFIYLDDITANVDALLNELGY